MPERPLAGCGIVITRPAAQAATLTALIRAQGGSPIGFPLLSIEPLDDYRACDAVLATLERAQWAIFISSNAVEQGMPRILRQFPQLLPALRYAAVGPLTAAEIRRHAPVPVLTPAQRFDSEALLALPEMQAVAGHYVVIVRGVGGRELLADTLRQRGAQVAFAECYRRAQPQADAGDLPRLWQNNALQAIVVTSSEALRALLALGRGAAWLQATPIFTSHARIAAQAREAGLHAVEAAAPGDEAMLQCLIQHQQQISSHE